MVQAGGERPPRYWQWSQRQNGLFPSEHANLERAKWRIGAYKLHDSSLEGVDTPFLNPIEICLSLATEPDAFGYLVEFLLRIFSDVSGIEGIKAQAFIRIASEGQVNSLRERGGIGSRANENASLSKQRSQGREDKLRSNAKMLQHF